MSQAPSTGQVKGLTTRGRDGTRAGVAYLAKHGPGYRAVITFIRSRQVVGRVRTLDRIGRCRGAGCRGDPCPGTTNTGRLSCGTAQIKSHRRAITRVVHRTADCSQVARDITVRTREHVEGRCTGIRQVTDAREAVR